MFNRMKLNILWFLSSTLYTLAIFIHAITAVKSSTNSAFCHNLAVISLVIIAASCAYELNLFCHFSISYQRLNKIVCFYCSIKFLNSHVRYEVSYGVPYLQPLAFMFLINASFVNLPMMTATGCHGDRQRTQPGPLN